VLNTLHVLGIRHPDGPISFWKKQKKQDLINKPERELQEKESPYSIIHNGYEFVQDEK